MKSEQEWRAWIARELKKREDVFTSDPDELVAAHRREIGYTRDYHGREILELLQNADDASGEPGTRSQRAALVLDEAGLCFANTGIPFSEDGVKSLMVSNNSPKKGETRYIGNRGLGFRSVLSWTTRPFIVSGNLRVGFSRDNTRAWKRGKSRSRKAQRYVWFRRLSRYVLLCLTPYGHPLLIGLSFSEPLDAVEYRLFFNSRS